ncbi:glycosyltransferase family 4 protein [Pontixanthobacter gangjinensis]|uniref:Glycosyltransferase family 4 protein n=1 Tax=Christiangramia aestuarii TaxID=1028746 RepID=A0A7K1LPN9_9FLAO|nr:glycosyltransferase family 4 protein [Christiangramia aestuarii]MUP42762.1 glycosyltransferase family 4 protein [Christiangramia aestuarii]
MAKLLVIGYVWPEPTSSAAGTRMMQLLKLFRNSGYEVIFASTAKETQNKADLSSLGIVEEKIQLNDPSFDSILKRLDPEIVLFDRFMMEEQFGWRVDENCPEALKILDTEDLHFLREARQKAFKENRTEEQLLNESELAKREIAAIYRCDLSLIISEPEIKLLQDKFNIPEDILFYLPYMFSEISSKEQEMLPGFEERKDFISIGNFLHEPNWQAVLYLKEKIWPEIRKKLPDARMNIYGAYASQKVVNLHNARENFLVHGWVEDSTKAMKESRVCLAPINFGAGLKGKLVEAMQNGTVSVTTPTGAEGINAEMEWNGFITHGDREFINRAVELYSNQDLWEQKQQKGFEIINSRFNGKEHGNLFQQRINLILNNLKDHRNMNFTGKMLRHHLHRSTYFMSRFIEEKNRNKK